MNDCVFHAKAALSAIYDPALGLGIVLDDEDGDYWRLERATLATLRDLAALGAGTVADLEARGHNDARASLESLTAIRLVGAGSPSPTSPTEQARHLGKPRSFRLPSPGRRGLPAAVAVVRYVLLNLRFQLETLARKWHPIRRRRWLGTPNVDGDPAQDRAAAEYVIACMRIASAIPLVSRSCIPRALTAFELLRHWGLKPRLVVGAYVEPFEPHVWAECGQEVTDSGHMDFSLQVFVPLRELDLAP